MQPHLTHPSLQMGLLIAVPTAAIAGIPSPPWKPRPNAITAGTASLFDTSPWRRRLAGATGDADCFAWED